MAHNPILPSRFLTISTHKPLSKRLGGCALLRGGPESLRLVRNINDNCGCHGPWDTHFALPRLWRNLDDRSVNFPSEWPTYIIGRIFPRLKIDMLKSTLVQLPLLLGSALAYSGIHSRAVNSILHERSAEVTTHTSYAFEKTAELVYEVLNRVANHSWEWGAQAEVILERSRPEYSVYSNTRHLPLSEQDGPLEPPQQLIEFIEPILAKRVPGTLPLVDGDGASGDPASLGVAVLVAAATSNKEKAAYFQKLADGQLDWLLNHVPASEDGAISQRDKELQYWSDYMYMAPPFLAYYGAATSNATLLEIAYNQAKQYRTILQGGKIKVWQHIVDGSFEDRSYWSTGNGWAAAGMMRIYATFLNLRDPKLNKLTQPWRDDLAKWVIEIVKGAYAYQYKDSYLLPNYLANTNASHN
ncbi:hypothetical protein PCASD_20290, partial [Puccinia coronata f. sp. avenae]